MNLLNLQEYGENIYYIVLDKYGLVHNCERNTTEPFDKKNVKYYAQWPTHIGGGLAKVPSAEYQINIVVYAMQKDSKGKYRPKEGDKIIKIFTSP